MRIGEIRIYKNRRLEERCGCEPIRDAEAAAFDFAQMIAKYDYPRGTSIDASNPRNLKVGAHRVRVLNAGNY